MSLINDMLRDLEKREQQQDSPAHEGAPVVTKNQRSLKGIIAVGVVFVLIALVWFGIGIFSEKKHFDSLTTAPVAQPSVPRRGNVEKAATKPQVPRVVTMPNTPSASVVTSSAEVPPVASSLGKLSHLSIATAGEQTVLNLSFIQFPQYQLVEQDGENAGLMIRFDGIQLGDEFEIPSTENSLVKRISLVPQKESLRLLIDLVPETRILSSQLLETSQQNFRLQIAFVASKLVEEPVKTVDAVMPAPQLVEKMKEKQTEEGKPVVAKTSKQTPVVARDKQAYRAGLEQSRSGQIAEAEASFIQALLINPEFLDARLQLVSLLQQQRKFVKAEEFLQQGLSLTPESPVLRKTYARQLLQEQRGRKAVDLLRSSPVPMMAHDLEYHALLAAALQRVGEYAPASAVYAQLIKLRPQEALWWLGMAVSLEQSGHREESRDAYQKALSLPGLRPDLQSYIQGRLQAL